MDRQSGVLIAHVTPNRVIPDPVADNIASVLDAARQALPHLSIILAPHCHGLPWQVDACCATVYIAADTDDPQVATARLADAVHALLDDQTRHGTVSELGPARDELAARRGRRRSS